ncbi:hypothetical protein JQ604_21935 [Bradyrhizobium jicamae]|uniref:hypothetical protein n=1 Tax=Bradyrhizobium jicamae TaxID=280332 RepID=UPI001BAC9AAE|nr:hypothetical protein [Bradyrhizobium jicamae]MBR0754856.1 hypothetical protein [Bradyrhizobium jicamae]
MIQESSQTEPPRPDRIVRCFWHGRFSPYEALCLSSFVAAGITVEVFSDGPVEGLPAGAVLRDAREILDRDVAFYRHEFDGPSPSLHSNHFRYALLEQLGGWWIDTDVLLLASALPAQEAFIARQSDHELNGAVMRFPPAHPLIAAARRQTEDKLEGATWGDVGPKLLTALQPIHAPAMPIAPRESSYGIGPDEFQKFLLPEAREEVEARTADATFVHLWNEMWRRAGIPKTIAPPRGSWLDVMFERSHPAVTWADRLDPGHVVRWAALRRDRDHAGYYNLVHDRELKRLQAELDEQRRRSRGVSRFIRGLMRRLRKS